MNTKRVVRLNPSLRIATAAIAAGFMFADVDTANAQAYPTKPVRVITNSPGGSGEIVARLVSQGLSANLGQQFVVDPHGGSGGLISGEMLAKAPPDGYTIMIYSNTIWIAPLMREKQTYDVLRDFAPTALISIAPDALVVHPSLPVKSARDLIALAKEKPGTLNYGSSGIGSTSHIAGELFKAMAGVNIVRVNYKGVVPAIADVVAGNVQLTFGSPGVVTGHVKSGRLRALGVASAERSALFPGLPTIAETGLPGYVSESAFGIFAPANTPSAIINKLNQETVKIINQREVKEQLFNIGSEVVSGTPEQFTAMIKNEVTKVGKLMKDLGIKEQ